MKQFDRIPAQSVVTAAAKTVLPHSTHEVVRELWWGSMRRLPHRVAARTYPGIPGRVHIADTMVVTTGDDAVHVVDDPVGHYITSGQSAMQNIEASLVATSRGFADIEDALDFPCGYGRVLRWLVRRIPPGRITASDIDAAAVRFCAREFQVESLLSEPDVRSTDFPRTYDLIWVGSLLTHLPVARCINFLDALTSILKLGGVIIFTTIGEEFITKVSSYGRRFEGVQEMMNRNLARDGVTYWPYYKSPQYGVTIHSRRYVQHLLDKRYSGMIKLIRLAERGWHDHQDVWSCQRISTHSSA